MENTNLNYKPDQRYIDKLEKHIESLKDASRYSLERFDILVISLSTSILVLSAGFINNLIPDIHLVDTTCLQLAWGFLTISLISNLVSQVSGYYANKLGVLVSKNLIRKERNKPVKISISEKEKQEKKLNNLTMILNGVSLMALISGIVFIMSFISTNI